MTGAHKAEKETSSRQTKKKKDNPLLSLLINIVIPVIILSRFSTPERLGPLWGLIVALAFPVIYGTYEVIKDKKYNVLSIIGVISVFLTGILGVLQIDPQWIAIKEAAVPFIILILIIASMNTKFPIVKKLIYNDAILNIEKIESKLHSKKQKDFLDKKLKTTTWLVAISFVISTILNYTLAKVLLVSEPGTEAFNQELARMTALSFPVIALPASIMMIIALFYYMAQLQKITGLELEEMLKEQ